jgi:serine protease Do
MKKYLIFILIALFTLTMTGCGFYFAPVGSSTETTTSSNLTTGTQNSVSQTTINKDLIVSEIYAQIYESMYDDVLNAVIEDISEERFETLYADTITLILQEIDAGNITVNPETIIERLLMLEATTANAVVGIANYNESGTVQAVGSGVIYKKELNKYYVVTNDHVIEDGDTFKIVLEDGTEIAATVRGKDSLVDLAVLYFFSDLDLKVVEFGNSDELNKGEIIVAVGHPSGFDYYGSLTMGVVSGLDRYFDIDGDNVKDMFVGYIQHDAAINSGNSGGALFNLEGELIGINVIKLSAIEIEGMGFAIPSNLTKAIVEDIELYGVSKQKPILGIEFIDIKNNPLYFVQQGITLPEGVDKGFYITGVKPNNTMDGYIQLGDIIIEIGDVIIDSSRQFVEEFSIYRVGDVISVTLIREGQTIIIENIELKASVD